MQRQVASNVIETAIGEVLIGSPRGTYDERVLRDLLDELQTLGCRNLGEKLVEYKKARASGRLGSLIAELRFAHFVARRFACTPEFSIGDTADISFAVDGVDCLLEVVHKSSPHPLSVVFSPDPDDLPAHASGPPWKQPACKLQTALANLPVAILPWVARDFVKQCVTWQERERQELACGAAAEWLADHIGEAFTKGISVLQYTDGETRFEIERIKSPPGYMKGFAALSAWYVTEGTFRGSIENKASKATSRLRDRGADCYLIGLDVDDAIASLGTDVPTTLLGPLVHCETPRGARQYRGVPHHARATLQQARAAGRVDLLELARFDETQQPPPNWPLGVYFDAATADVGAVLASYYTGKMQFVPNPFTRNSIERIRRSLPAHLEPFDSN